MKREFVDTDQNGDIKNGWKLIDFDRMSKIKDKGKYVGTPGWSPPEMEWSATNKNKYTIKNDIFSLGLVMIYCLNGSQPFEITDDDRKEYGVDIVFNSDGDKWCELDKNIQERYFRNYLYFEMVSKWYNDRLKTGEQLIQNYLVKMYFDGRISMELLELLKNMLVYDVKRRWDYKQIWESKWMESVRD